MHSVLIGLFKCKCTIRPHVKPFHAAFLLFALLNCCVPAIAQDETIIVKGHPAHPTRLLAKFKNPSDANGAKSLAAIGQAGLNLQHQYGLVPGLVVLDEPKNGNLAVVPAVPEVDAKTKAKRLAERISALNDSGVFEYVEPDYIVNIKATPSDPAFVVGTLWGLRNTGQNGGVSGADIGATAAWNVTTGSQDVIVAVIDTGIRYTHRDLSANMWRNPGEIPGNGIDDDGDGYVDNVFGINAINGSGDPIDVGGHGTHVAGTIGAVANDSNPHVGVAWKVRLMACKFLGTNGGKISDAIKCIDFAVSKGARILNNSWGGGPYEQALFDAIRRARDQGVLFVAAAGNDGTDNDITPHYPSSYQVDNIIAVAAIDRRSELADFRPQFVGASCYGRTSVHIGAPGKEIFSCWNGSDTDYKTIPGTSMAAPHVTGIAALVLSKYPNISVSQLRNQILNSVVPVAALQNKTITGGRVNAFNALNRLPDGKLEVAINPVSGSALLAGSSVRLSVKVADLIQVTNASVSGSVQGVTNLVFGNSGYAPDGIYTSTFTAPSFADAISVVLAISAPGKTSTNITVTFNLAQPAVNNDFAKRTILPGLTNVTVFGSNVRASKEAGEPYHGVHLDVPMGGKSVWWSWTAPISGIGLIETTGSSFDTLLAVYTGNAANALTRVASNDDVSGAQIISAVTFDAVVGITYQIAVDSAGEAAGAIQLAVHLYPPVAPPANDSFNNSSVIPSGGGVGNAANFGASKESGEPNHAGNAGGRSVWYSWTAPSAGVATINTTNANFDTMLAVYTGSTVSALTLVAENDDEQSGMNTSKVFFDTVAGTTYRIALDGFNGGIGLTRLKIDLAQSSAGPVNDFIQNASQISGISANVYGSNVGATKASGEPNHGGNSGGKSVWWYWTAPSSGRATITTFGSSLDTLLGVYTGTSINALTTIASNDDEYSGSQHSKVVFNATAGQTYRIAVDGYAGWFSSAASGNITLILSLYTGQPPANNNFANRIVLTGANVSTNGSNIGATKEAGEPAHAGNSGGHSVWWSWTPLVSGLVTISTSGSDFDTLLAVYTGASVSSLNAQASNNDNPNGGTASQISFNVMAGTTYQIVVDGFYGASGNIALTINLIGSSTTLYQTQFAYADGYRTTSPLVGQNGWRKAGSGGNGILTNNFQGYGQQGFVGYYAPNSGSGLLELYYPLNFVPDLSKQQIVKFSVLFKIVDSSGWFGPRDHFRWSFYNNQFHRLFAIDFDNNMDRRVSYLLDDGSGYRDTGYQFINGAVHKLEVYLFFSANLWGATLDGVGLNPSLQPITTSGAALNLADIDASWFLTTLNSPGDNYMVFDNYSVELITPMHPPTITSSPQSQSVSAGTAVQLAVAATGTTPMSYQWYRNSVPIAGATTNVLSLPNITTNQAGRYTVVVSNSVGSVTSDGAVILVNPLIPPPANDQFANRINLAGFPVIAIGSNIAATKETGEPIHANSSGSKSVWWEWTSPITGRISISTVGSDFDTLLGVYTGPNVSSLAPIAANDDAQSLVRGSWVSFGAVANTAYKIAVDGYNGDSGNIRLSIKPDATPKFTRTRHSLGNGLEMGILGEQGLVYEIQASTNLNNWVTLTNVWNSAGEVNFSDKGATNFKTRFYRLIQK